MPFLISAFYLSKAKIGFSRKSRQSVFLLFFLFSVKLTAQQHLLQSGPMVGAAGQSSVKLWVQTKHGATVSFVCYTAAQPGKKWHSQPIKTRADNAFAATVVLDDLLPGKEYQYELFINQKKIDLGYLLTFQTLPDSGQLPNFSFAAGSCAFGHSDSAHVTFRIYTEILKKNPDFMLWLGDNLYLGSHAWNSQAGVYSQYTFNRSIKAVQPLLGSVHHYAIWDDHDFGNNNANRNWKFKDFSLEAFRTFWPNPGYPAEGTYSTFTWADAQFFLLDGRWFRSSSKARKSDRQMLGKDQLNWLLTELSKSKATFKFLCIGSQVLSTSNSSENYKRYGKELENLLERIEDAEIEGLVFLDGDRHFTELSKLNRKFHYPLYGLTVSPLTSNAARGKANFNRVPGTLVTQHNFAVLEITGKKGDRKVGMKIFDAAGNQLWHRQLSEHELKN